MPELACKIDGCDYSGSPQGLRSHLHGRKDDEHVAAAEERRHHDWYPAAYGLDVDDDGTDDPDEGDDTPTEGGQSDPSEGGSEEGSDEEGDDTLETDPTEEGSESPDEGEEYRQQWEAASTPTEGGESDPSEGGSTEGADGEGEDTLDSDPSDPSDEGGSGGLGTALVLGTGALALAVLLRGRGSTPSESPDVENEAVPDEVGTDSGSGWSQEGGPTPVEGDDSDEMTFTATET